MLSRIGIEEQSYFFAVFESSVHLSVLWEWVWDRMGYNIIPSFESFVFFFALMDGDDGWGIYV
jgi:hypothetical protein